MSTYPPDESTPENPSVQPAPPVPDTVTSEPATKPLEWPAVPAATAGDQVPPSGIAAAPPPATAPVWPAPPSGPGATTGQASGPPAYQQQPVQRSGSQPWGPPAAAPVQENPYAAPRGYAVPQGYAAPQGYAVPQGHAAPQGYPAPQGQPYAVATVQPYYGAPTAKGPEREVQTAKTLLVVTLILVVLGLFISTIAALGARWGAVPAGVTVLVNLLYAAALVCGGVSAWKLLTVVEGFARRT